MGSIAVDVRVLAWLMLWLVTVPVLESGLRIRIQIQSGQWIRIRVRNPDPDPGGQK
jgi:hypothetical protein